MKRSQHAGPASRPEHGSPVGQAFDLTSGLFTPPARDMARALFAPLHYEPNYAYPLVVWLHGPGNDEFQLMRIMPHISMRNYVAVAPRGLSMDGGADGPSAGWSQEPEAVQEAEQRIFEGVEAAQQKYHIAPRRIFLAGFGCGGTMAFRVAMNHPRRFAGVLSLGGEFPRGQTPLGQWNDARHLAVFLALGRDSAEYPPEKACEDLRLLHTAGLSVTLRQYPCGQQLSTQVLGDMDRWIMEQIATTHHLSVQQRDRV